MQRFGFFGQQVRQQGADDGIGIEFIEGRVDFQRRYRQPDRAKLRQGAVGGVLLATQVARQAAVEAQTQFGQVAAEDFRLAHTGRRQHVVVVCTEGGLAMSNQVDAAHVRVIPVR
ncbi:hypothetical protein D3C80_1857450 [compost metagenome]